jgi:hypothetical protein
MNNDEELWNDLLLNGSVKLFWKPIILFLNLL